MNFPQITLDINAYDAKLSALLSDTDCLIFFDTNILAKMFSLHKGARDEFASWVQSKKIRPHERVVLPAWCLHEYTNRVIRNKLNSYVDVGKFIDEAQALLPKLGRQLDMYVDDTAASKKGGRNRNTLLQDLRAAQQAYLSLLPAADNSENTITAIHHEIVDLFSDCVQRSDIFYLLTICKQEYETRFGNNVPPGFRDGNKPANNLGDFIIWREIVAAAKKRDKQKILYISDDQKLDWVYFPLKLIQGNGRPAGNNRKNGLTYPLIDPRLEYELALALNREPDIMIISFEQLANMLSQEDNLSFRQLAESVQEINRQQPNRHATTNSAPVPTESLIEEPTPESQLVPIMELADQEPTVSPLPNDNPAVEVIAVNELDTAHFTYSSTALADATYSIPESSVGEVITMLKSHTWDTQNAGISMITRQLLNTALPDELFVLGRNILQAATGSSFDAERFLIKFRTSANKQNPIETSQHLVNGMLYEVYFNSHNEFRGSEGKAYYVAELSALIHHQPNLIPCARFIEEKLEPFGELVLFIPYVREQRHQLKLSFRSVHSADEKSTVEILDSCSIDNEVISNTISDEEEISSTYPQRRVAYYAYDLDKLMRAVSLSRYIPFIDEFIDVTWEVDYNPISEEELGEYVVPPNLVV